MKKILYILTSIILACTSCTGELGLDCINKKDGFTLTIYNAPLTKAIDNTGEAYERELKTLDIFFYPKDETGEPCVFYHHKDLTDTYGQAEITINVVEDAIRSIFPSQNLCDIFVIANLPASVKPDDAVFAAGSDDTRIDRLNSYILQIADNDDKNFVAEYDAIDKPFVMAGLGIGQKDSKKNAQGSISLVRAASKVTISIAIPDYIDVKKITNGIEQTVRMVHTYEDNPDISTMNTAFQNGAYKGYLHKEVDESMDEFYLSTSKQKFTYSKTLPAIKHQNSDQDSIPQRRVYNCDVPFYTYAREWEKGAPDAAYMTFEMKWGADKGDGSVPVYETYYYQILINGSRRTFEPNHWYDMYVNVGVIGSVIEIKPILLDHLELFVLDWSDTISGVDHPEEDVELDNYTYFNVITKRLELDNVTTGVIEYKASHDIAWELDTSNKSIDGIENTTTRLGAFYIDCSSSTIVAEEINGFSLTDNGNGVLRYTYTIPDNIYSPVYIYLTLWLELDGKNGMSNEEKAYSEPVTIVQYPSIYIIPDASTEYSIFVNGRYRYGNDITYRNGNVSYNLGKSSGDSDRGDQMYVISVSTFTEDDTFRWRARSADAYEDKSYIIGDPRTRTPMNFANYNMTNNWVKDNIPYNADINNYNNVNNVENGSGRRLQYYYPTSTDQEAYRLIAPKFRMSSFFGGYSNNCTAEGAVLRCASYQEDGYPAGRWRVPTTAEVQFVISLQEKKLIVPIFYDGNYYYSASQQVSSTGEVRANADDNNTSSSVRCVYDEWYWGSEKEAVKNDGYEGGYQFTWGDEIIW